MNSLHVRAILAAFAWIACSLSIGGFIIWSLFSASAERQFDARIEAVLDNLAAAVAVTDRTGSALDARLGDPRFQRPFSGFYWEAIGPGSRDNGAIILRSRSLWDEELQLPIDEVPDGVVHRHDIPGPSDQALRALERTLVTPASDEWRIAVAADRQSLDAERTRFGRSLTLSLLALGAILVLAAAAQAVFVLHPLRRLRSGIADYRAGRSKRLEVRVPSELQPLVGDLNDLLDSNDKLVAQARRRAGDLAHALKTPAAALRNELDSLVKDVGSDRLLVAQESLGRIEHQTRRQLARARISFRQPSVRTGVGEIVERLKRTMKRVHSKKNLTIEGSVEADTTFQGDAEDLEEILGNLMDNACKWARSQVLVSAKEENGATILTVDDDGPGVPKDQRDFILDAGTRLDEFRAGSGLGLAIVSDIVEAYSGKIDIDASELNGGLRVTVRV